MSRLKNIWSPKSLVLVFLDFEQGECVVSAGKIKAGKTEPQEFEQFDSLEDAVKHFGKSKPIHLHILGTGVLSRKIQSSNAFQQDLIMNGNPNEFLFTTFDDGNNMAVSFCRKSLIEAQFKKIDVEKWHLYGMSCGYSAICGVLEDESISTDFSISIKNDQLVSFQRAKEVNEKTFFRDEHWTSKSLIAQAISSQLGKDEKKWNIFGENEGDSKRENYNQFNQFKILGLGILGVILLSLLINHFYHNSLNNDVAQLEMNLSVHNENLSLLERLSQEKMRKEQLIASAGVNSSSFLSYYLDNIGESVPKSITLSDMTVFPVEGKLKDKQKVEVNQKRIGIAGITPENVVLDDWIEKMDRFEWVESVELINYLKSSEQSAEFEIEINLAQ